MIKRADDHFDALKEIISETKRLILLDYDDPRSFHPVADNPVIHEWARKNIENYLLVKDAWIRAALQKLQCTKDDLFAQPVLQTINTFFNDQNLTLPESKTWRNVSANIFSAVDGKRILFEDNNSLFNQLQTGDPSVKLIREEIAINMSESEIHQDVLDFMNKLIRLTRIEK